MPILFDEIDDFVNFGDVLDLGLNDFSIAALLDLTSVADNFEIVTKFQSGSELWLFRISSDEIRFVSVVGGSLVIDARTDVTSLTTGVKYYIVYTNDRNGSHFIYLDCVSQSLGAADLNIASATSLNNTANLEISRSDDNAFAGTIHEVSIWIGTALSQNDVNQLCLPKIKRGALQVQPGTLSGGWALDDGPNGTSADGDTIRDFSGNSIDGTGDHGGGASGLTWQAEDELSYPGGIIVPGISAAAPSGIIPLIQHHRQQQGAA